MIEGQMGLNWDRWRSLIDVVEGSGFAGLFRSDHFTNPSPPDDDSLELVTSLTYLADHSERIHFGSLVAPVSFRDPVMLARQAAAIDDLSGGRFILGLGAGWQQREHEEHGYELLSVPERFRRLEEALEVTTRLFGSGEPVSFEGRYYRLRDARLRPRPARPGGPPVLVGGSGPKRTLPLVARYADIWNGLGPTPDEYRDKCALLDELLAADGRKPGDVRRTLMTGVFFGGDERGLERRLAPLLARPQLQDKTAREVAELLRARGAIVGTPDDISEQLRTYAEAGVEEIMLQWLDLDDLAGLEAFARAAVP